MRLHEFTQTDYDGHLRRCCSGPCFCTGRPHISLCSQSPAASRPGFRMACQAAANNHWDIIHIDRKTAFLQGESYDESRNVICELPKESGQPWYMVARMKKPAYDLNDAHRRWFNVVDKELRSCECVPTRGDRCTYVFYFKQQKLANGKSQLTSSGTNLKFFF